jgi:hypothetical protein
LIELLKAADEDSARRCITDYNEAISDNADFILANGVIVPPVKIGQTVYDYAGRECVVFGFSFYKEGLPYFATERTGYHGVKICTSHAFDRVGESVFLTREDAERALKESEGEI